MTPFLIYILKSSVSLSLFYLLFKITMTQVKWHRINRFLMLGIIIASLFFPLMNVSFIPEKTTTLPFQLFNPILFPIEILENAEITNTIAPSNFNEAEQPLPWQTIIYGSVILLFLLYGVISLIRIVKIIRRSEDIRFKKRWISLAKEQIEPFTFITRIVMTKKDFTENRDILVEHEQAHVELAHWVDLFLMECVTALQWFNPFMWMFRHDLKLIHEYQADEAALKTGIDAQKYQLLVLEKAVGERRFALANQFNQKPILKRFKMIQKKQQSRWAGLKLLFFVPLAALMLQAFSSPEVITSVVNNQTSDTGSITQSQWMELWNLDNFLKNGATGISIVDNNVQLHQAYIPTLEDHQKNPNVKAANPPEGSVEIKAAM